MGFQLHRWSAWAMASSPGLWHPGLGLERKLGCWEKPTPDRSFTAVAWVVSPPPSPLVALDQTHSHLWTFIEPGLLLFLLRLWGSCWGPEQDQMGQAGP